VDGLKKHEDFEISDSGQAERKKVVRQDRLDVEDLNCNIQIGADTFKVANVSPFGIAIFAEQSLKTNSEFHGIPVLLNNVEIANVHMKFVREVNSDKGLICAFEVLGEPISMSRISAVQDSESLVNEHKESLTKFSNVPAEFKAKVFEIKESLEDLQERVHTITNAVRGNDAVDFEDYEHVVVQMVGQHISDILPSKNDVLSSLIPQNAELVKDCIEFFREKLKAIIYQAPFSDRVFHKPLGYAGDYEMMNIIYKGGNNGATPFAKCLNFHWVSQPAAQAVRNRVEYLKRKLQQTLSENKKRPLKILSVACGPAKEWQHMISEIQKFNDQEIEIHLLDQDEGALKHAQRKIRALSVKYPNSFKFQYINKAIKNVIARGLDDKYDLIYSAGLFDYFSDPVAQLAATRLHQALNPKGQLIIGNFNVSNPNSIMMDLALDWHLIYRSEADLKKMFSVLNTKIDVEKEGLGINLFCVIQNNHA